MSPRIIGTAAGRLALVTVAAIAALTRCEDHIAHMLKIYGRRRNLVIATLQQIGIHYQPPRGTFYLWVPVPQGTTSLEFTNLLFEKAHVVVAPGRGYGEQGEGFVRFSLTVSDARLEEAMERIRGALG